MAVAALLGCARRVDADTCCTGALFGIAGGAPLWLA